MPRQPRSAPGGYIYHVFNRASGKLRPFKKEADYLAFEQVIKLAHEQVPIRILSWSIMPKHWHFVLWPKSDGELTAFMRKLTHTHAQRWKQAHDAVGQGALYQGRFKSFPVQIGQPLLALMRYVERNPVRVGLVKRAQDWPHGSFFVRKQKKHELHELLTQSPVALPADWTRWVNEAHAEKEEAALATHIHRNRPLGDDRWTQHTVKKLGLEQSLRAIGRPVGWRKKKTAKKAK